MASRGVNETAKLRSNIEEQLTRLMAQLEDIESLRDDIDEEEYPFIIIYLFSIIFLLLYLNDHLFLFVVPITLIHLLVWTDVEGLRDDYPFKNIIYLFQ